VPETDRLKFIIEVDEKGTPTVRLVEGEIDRLDKTAERSGRTFQSVRAHWMAYTAALAAGVYAIKKGIDAVLGLANAYGVQESAENDLMSAMINAGTYTEASFEMLKKYAAELQEVTRFGDELTLSMMANLQTYGMTTDELKRATVATMDLAVAKKMDLFSASELVGKAFVGETGTLSRYGIILDENIPKTEKFAAVLKLINERFGGRAQAEVNTYRIQVAQLANMWGDLKEKIGGLLIPVLIEVIKWLKAIIKWAERAGSAIKKWLYPSELDKARATLEQINTEIRTLEAQMRGLEAAGAMAARAGLNRETVEQRLNDLFRERIEMERTIAAIEADRAKTPPPATPPPRQQPPPPETPAPWVTIAVADFWMDFPDWAEKTADSQATLTEGWYAYAEALGEATSQSSKATEAFQEFVEAQQIGLALHNAVRDSLVAYILGYENFGAALKKATAQVLAQLAAEAAIRALWHTAMGIAALTPWGAAAYGPAAAQFKAAAMFGAIAVMAGAAAMALQKAAAAPTGAERAGYAEARGAGVGGVSALAREAEPTEYAQKYEITIVNPIGTTEWVEATLIPELKKVAKRDVEITVRYS
jgi:hypothetical protein